MFNHEELKLFRDSEAYNIPFEKANPLVTVCISTDNRANLLLNRSLQSVVNQTYRNLEIIVIGDCCTDNTEDVIKTFNDPRIHFENLPEHGAYPTEPFERWMVAGTIPLNRALELASGDFVTHLDDDDEFTPERIEKLVNYAKETRADFIFHPFWWESGTDQWVIVPAGALALANVTTSSVFYHRWFKHVPWDINAYKYAEPGDWNRFKKAKELDAKLARFPELLTRKYNFTR